MQCDNLTTCINNITISHGGHLGLKATNIKLKMTIHVYFQLLLTVSVKKTLFFSDCLIEFPFHRNKITYSFGSLDFCVFNVYFFVYFVTFI